MGNATTMDLPRPEHVRLFLANVDAFARSFAAEPWPIRRACLRLFVGVTLRSVRDDDERRALRETMRDALRRARAELRLVDATRVARDRNRRARASTACDVCGWSLAIDDAARGVCRPCRRRIRETTGTDPLQVLLPIDDEERGPCEPCAFCSHVPGSCPASCNCACIVGP